MGDTTAQMGQLYQLFTENGDTIGKAVVEWQNFKRGGEITMTEQLLSSAYIHHEVMYEVLVLRMVHNALEADLAMVAMAVPHGTAAAIINQALSPN